MHRYVLPEWVKERVLRRQAESHMELARLVIGVAERVGALEGDGVGRVPQQPLPAMFQIEIDRGKRRFEHRGDGLERVRSV